MSLSLERAQKKKKPKKQRTSAQKPLEASAPEPERPRQKPWNPSVVEGPPATLSEAPIEDRTSWTELLGHFYGKALEFQSNLQGRKIRIPLPGFLTIREDEDSRG